MQVKHGLHLVLTILTCGLWLPVWIIIAACTPKSKTQQGAAVNVYQPIQHNPPPQPYYPAPPRPPVQKQYRPPAPPLPPPSPPRYGPPQYRQLPPQPMGRQFLSHRD